MSTVVMLVGLGCIFAGIVLLLSMIGVMTPESKGINRSLAVLDALSSAPTSMTGELDQPFRERVLNPLLSKSLGIGRRLTPADHNDRIRQKLELAGNPDGWNVDRVTSLKVIGFALALALSLVVSLVMSLGFAPTLGLVVVASLIGYSGPNFILYQKAYDRTAILQRALPDALDLLTISVESGLGFDAALAHVAKNTDGPLADEFARVLQEMQIGRARSDSLRSLGDRTNLPDLRSFISAMVQADAFGIPIGQVLRVQSSEIRVKRRQWAEEQAQKVPVKILVPLIFCILPCLFIAVLGPAAISIMKNFAGV